MLLESMCAGGLASTMRAMLQWHDEARVRMREGAKITSSSHVYKVLGSAAASRLLPRFLGTRLPLHLLHSYPEASTSWRFESID